MIGIIRTKIMKGIDFFLNSKIILPMHIPIFPLLLPIDTFVSRLKNVAKLGFRVRTYAIEMMERRHGHELKFIVNLRKRGIHMYTSMVQEKNKRRGPIYIYIIFER